MAAPVSAKGRNFRARLDPVSDRDSDGRATFTLAKDRLQFAVSATNVDEYTGSHIHAGEFVGVEVILDEAGRVTYSNGSLSITGTITDADVVNGTVTDLVRKIENHEDPRVEIHHTETDAIALEGNIFPTNQRP